MKFIGRIDGGLSTIAFEEVAHAINDWYKVIRQHDFSKAAAMREEIKNTLPNMGENQTVLLYFNLIDSRYKLMTENYNESGELLDEVKAKALEDSTDDMIHYYFYFFSGMYEFHQKRYVNAIIYYKIAEERLKKIPDEIEKAEFHYYLSKAYYRINQNVFSMTYAKIAYDTFKAHDSYKDKMINSEIMLGVNKLDLLLYEEAQKHFENVQLLAKESGLRLTESFALFNLGITYERQKMFIESSNCFKQALNIPEHLESFVGVRSMYMLSKVLFQLGAFEGARTWYEIALKKALDEGEREYLAKLNLVYALYAEQNDSEVRKNISVLDDMKLWTETADLSLEIAEYYKGKADFKKAAYYFEHSHFAKDKIIKISEALL
ncbi:aspartate phosphatase [Bacillus haynesii]|uniref:Rap family tetratricopeptide repeat protein n=1 Tax=Bacillus TaxID=1386 RepID=UPI002282E63C|nr:MULTISPECIES: Rap family tetratricopeptide repeat protein [Bacillus]MCY7773454.1 aspartate phosphatase [Bacillus licheniformis]MCY8530064.1 aspartate phosphatase [Bacillus licheniformis]MCY9266915.1 aspartate phosphatase [Bacillus licheniformis]MCY9288279.1 aspartate phosphatase [Bacillus haynesii]